MLHDVAPSGQVLLARESARAGLMVAPDGGEERDLAWFDGSLLSDLSGDGKVVLFVEAGGEAASHAVFLRKTDGSPAVRLGDGLLGKLSPDGKSVLVLPPDGSAQLSLLPTGAGDSVSLPLSGLLPSWAAFFLDGKRILVAGHEAGHGARFYALDGAALQPLTPEGMPLAPAAVSRDGRRLAALDPQQHLAVYEEGAPPRPVAGADRGEIAIGFGDDGRSLYVFRPGDLPAQVRRCPAGEGRCEKVRELMPADPAGLTGIFAAVLTADARGYAYGYRRVLSDLYLVDGLR